MSAVRWKKAERGEREDENKKFKSGDARKVRGERRLMMRMGERVRMKPDENRKLKSEKGKEIEDENGREKG